MEFVRSSPNCFDRDNVPGHVTAATWLLDPTGTKVLLTHHAKLQKWLQLGGHADGNGNVAEVALIEAREESGIHEITVDSSEIFDIDIHRIPAQPQGVEHLHYDVRFIAFAAKTDTIVSAESIDLAWVPIGELRKYTTEPSMLRMAAKWLQLR